MEYYLAINNQQSGPFPASELVANGMTADTLVWYQGAPNWIKASAVPELAPYLPVEPAPVSQPQPVTQSQPVSFDPQPVSQPHPDDQATMVQQPESQPQPVSLDPQPISQPQSEGQATMIQQPSPYDPQPVSQPQYDPYSQPQANPYSQPSYPQQQYDPYGQPQINPYNQPSYPQQPQQQYDPYGQPQINGFGQQPQYPQPYGQPQYPQAYGQPQYPQAYGYDPNQVQIPPRPESNMVWAVLSTLCCCLPLGIVAIINASGVNSAYNAGRFEEAQSKADNAKNWAMWAAIVGVVINAIYFFVSMSGGY